MLTVTDIFAGAGGSSTGMAQVPGVQVAIAANHWQLAVDVHQANHEATEHACVDLHLEDPRNFPKTEVLWASPECTKWSIANHKAKALSVEMGGDPTLFDDVPAELESCGEDEISRSRLLMFDVLRFIEHHRYRAVVVENVVDVATQPKYAAAWIAWQNGLRKLGYQYRILSMNSMHAQTYGDPAPQSRDRLYVVAWPEREAAPDLDSIQQPKAWCPRCETAVHSRQAWKPNRTVGRYRAQYVFACPTCGDVVEPGWLPAASAIDWSLPGQRIGDREKPLSPKTMSRIREGLRRYAKDFVLDNNWANRGSALDEPFPTLTSATTKALILEAAGHTYDSADPKHPQHGQPGAYLRAWPVSDPLRTLHATASKALIVNHVSGSDASRSRPVSDPLPTLVGGGNHASLLIPVEGRNGKRASPVMAPLRTQTTRNESALLVPYYSASRSAKPVTEPMGTLTTVDRYALVMRNNSAAGDAGYLTTPVTEPFRTFTTTGHQSLLEPESIDVEECLFRMLEPHEIAAGMSFPLDYRWQGTKRERVRLAGNAVTPPAARDILTALAASIVGA